MYLKRLSMKGFKSFADATNLDLEAGVTVVVGPNGSGKSNVVDAIAWVLGAQAPSAVRSQKMDDVIFAGTSKRTALGRAEVSLAVEAQSARQRAAAAQALAQTNAEVADLERARDEVTNEREARLALTRRVVAAEHGLPPELAARLQGTTEQELNDDAAGLAELIPKAQTNPPAKLAGIGTAPGVTELDPLAMHRKLTGR